MVQLRAFLTTGTMQVVGRVCAIVMGVMIARTLGAEAFGYYSYLISLVMIITLVSTAGVVPLTNREVARLSIANDYSGINKYLKWVGKHTFIAVSIFSIFLFVYLKLSLQNFSWLIILSMLIIAFLRAFLLLQSAILVGVKKTVQAVAVSLAIMPMTALVLLSVYYSTNTIMNVELALEIQMISAASALIFSMFWVKRLLFCPSVKVSKTYAFHQDSWNRQLIPLASVTIVAVLNAELSGIVLGIYGYFSELGHFKVALQASTLLALAHAIFNAINSPNVAIAYTRQEYSKVQMLISSGTQLSSLLAIVSGLILSIWGEELLAFFFGNDYISAFPSMLILLFGQLLNVLAGPCGMVLNMTNNEKENLKGSLLALVILIACLVAFVPLYGAVGASISVCISMTLWNIMMTFKVYRLTGLKTWFVFELPKGCHHA